MAFDTSTQQFLEDLDPYIHAGTWIRERLHRELPRIISSAPRLHEPSGCNCLVADMGDFLLRVLHVLASFATSLLQSDLISTYIDGKLEELTAEDDLHSASHLDDKHAALKQIEGKLHHALKDCQDIWSFTLPAPTPAMAFPGIGEVAHSVPQHHTSMASSASRGVRQSSSAHPARRHTPTRQGHPSHWATHEDNSFASSSRRGGLENISSEDDQRYAAPSTSYRESESVFSPGGTGAERSSSSGVPSMEQLKARGKGSYVCPHGISCDKGGVWSNGELRIFERNSAFRAHLQLHERVFKCDLPGCTNSKGFARVDQLERHKQTVRHDPPDYSRENIYS